MVRGPANGSNARHFPTARVAEKLAGFVKVRIDCTKDDGVNSKLQKEHNALTLPAIVFLSPTGSPETSASLYEFEPPTSSLRASAA